MRRDGPADREPDQLPCGITLAYSGAIVLRRFGGDIWVADLIGVAMTGRWAP